MRILAFAIVVAALSMSSAGLASAQATPNGGAARKVDAYLSSLVPFGFSGNVIVAHGNAVLLLRGYGLADREQATPMTPDTIISVGSITKQFTAAAILKLQDMSKLRVTDSIAKYLPGVPPDKTAITLHELLTHTSGLASDYGDSDYEHVGRDAYVGRALGAPLLSAPGAQFRYSNAGYSLLAAIVERVSGTSYEHFLHDKLFSPAGMHDTGYHIPHWPLARVAVGYLDGARWGRMSEHWAGGGPWWNQLGNGGIHSTPGDMYRWDRALQGDAVLSKSARLAFQTGYVAEGPEGMSKYAYGWSVMKSPYGTVIAHNGGNGIFAADFLRFVDAGVTIYIASNSSELRATTISRAVARIAFGKDVSPAPRIVTLTATSLEARTGTYAAADGSSASIVRDGSNLIVRTSSGGLFAALVPGAPIPPGIAADVRSKVEALLKPSSASPATSNDPWGDFVAHHGRPDSGAIVAMVPLDGDVGVWVSAMLKAKPIYFRMRFGPEGLMGMIVSDDAPNVLLRPIGRDMFVTYCPPSGEMSKLQFAADGSFEIITASGATQRFARGATPAP
jgi:CubicO group peptidase (beta-lactamase class C family)